MKTVIEMALQAGIFHEYDSEGHWDGLTNEALVGTDYMSDREYKLKRVAEILTPFAELVASLASADAIADERKAIMQLFTDPENQPTQYGTVTVEYMNREIADEREACAKLADAADMYNRFISKEIAAAIRARGVASIRSNT